MANITDYLTWRGDLLFNIDDFNEIDGAVLSRLTYQRFEMLSSSYLKGPLSLAIERILSLEDIEEKTLIKGDWSFMKTIVSSERFKNLEIMDYTDILEEESQTQFSALTLLDKTTGLLFVFFRGTDNTLLGWKEDFNMAFVTPLPGQKKAVEYLGKMSSLSDNKIIVGGHSKGGNLAVFASSFVDEKIQSRIRHVYNYDGPGFDEKILKEDGYKRICSHISTFVPQSSVVGMLLEHEEKYIIVHSTKSGIMQHDIYSWEVIGKSFRVLEEVDNSSRFIDSTLKEWLKSMDKDEREAFVDGIFDIMKSGNYSTLREMRENWLKSGMGMIKGALELPPERRKKVLGALSLLLKSSKIGLINFKK